jgi:hypothetical protein
MGQTYPSLWPAKREFGPTGILASEWAQTWLDCLASACPRALLVAARVLVATVRPRALIPFCYTTVLGAQQAFRRK